MIGAFKSGWIASRTIGTGDRIDLVRILEARVRYRPSVGCLRAQLNSPVRLRRRRRQRRWQKERNLPRRRNFSAQVSRAESCRVEPSDDDDGEMII